MSKSKIFAMVAGLLVVIVLAVICIFLPKEEEEEYVEEDKTEKTFVVDQTDKGMVNQIDFENEFGKFSVVKNEGRWVMAENESVEVDQYMVNNMLESACKIEATKKIEDAVKSKGEYGLDVPLETIVLHLDKGENKTYYVGVLNTALKGRYLYYEGNDDVYFIRIGLYNAFNINVNSMVEVDEYPSVNAENLVSLSIAMNGKEKVFGAKDEDAIAFVGKIKANECVCYDYEDGKNKEYGLDDPCLSIKVTYKEQGVETTYQVLVGDADEKTGEYYCVKNASTKICTFSEILVKEALTVFAKEK